MPAHQPAAAAAAGAATPTGTAAAAAPEPAAEAVERIREAFFQPGVMNNGLPPVGAAVPAVYDHIARSISDALASQQVPAVLAALCTATFPGVIGIRCACWFWDTWGTLSTAS